MQKRQPVVHVQPDFEKAYILVGKLSHFHYNGDPFKHEMMGRVDGEEPTFLGEPTGYA